MLYYIKTGDFEASIHATNHKQAAIKTLRNSDKDLGVCVIVNERQITDEDHSGNVYFLTQSILDECLPSSVEMRVVG